MLFNSYLFILVFLPLVVTGFYALRRQRARLLFLVAASYVFYAHEEPWFPALMAGSTVASFAGGLAVARAATERGRKLALGIGIAATLALLLYFKYAGFAAYYFSEALSVIVAGGLPSLEQFTRGIVLPVGISFYTFEGISYLVDVYRGTIQAERNPLRYLTFISFFPHLIAGPIVRYGMLRPQLDERRRFDPDDFRAGLLLFALGLVKKVLIADAIAFRSAPVLADPDSVTFVAAWAGMLAYSFQIYFDFSAYSDMALGLARMFGIQLPWNFDRPYRAASPREFWRRWHVTLSSWLRDYLYIPLGGNRKGRLRRDVNLLATMALGGLWHGASLNFVAWGVYWGALLVGNRHLERLRFRPPHALAVALTFALTTIGWVFFRFRVPGDIRGVFEGMAGLHGLGSAPLGLLVYLAVASVVVWGLREEWRWSLRGWGSARLATAAVLVAAAFVSLNDSVRFLYFQF